MIYIFFEKNKFLLPLTDYTDVTDLFYRNNLLAKARDFHRFEEEKKKISLNL